MTGLLWPVGGESFSVYLSIGTWAVGILIQMYLK